MKLCQYLACAAIAVALPGTALAATTTTTFQVTATVSSACSVSATALNFGGYNPLAVLDNDATSTIEVTCTLLTPYTVKLNGGSVNSDISARKMADGAERLNYQLYTDTLRTTVFGDGTTGSSIAGAGLGVAVPHIVYGRAVALQNVAAGSYADTVTVTVEY